MLIAKNRVCRCNLVSRLGSVLDAILYLNLAGGQNKRLVGPMHKSQGTISVLRRPCIRCLSEEPPKSLDSLQPYLHRGSL